MVFQNVQWGTGWLQWEEICPLVHQSIDICRKQTYLVFYWRLKKIWILQQITSCWTLQISQILILPLLENQEPHRQRDKAELQWTRPTNFPGLSRRPNGKIQMRPPALLHVKRSFPPLQVQFILLTFQHGKWIFFFPMDFSFKGHHLH